jgi:hypothetical protein
MGAKTSPPYKYEGSRLMEGIQLKKHKQIYYFFISQTIFQPRICCSSIVLAISEDILDGMLTLEQP